MTANITSGSSMPKQALKKAWSSSTAIPTEKAAIAQLVKAARDRGDDITGPDGLLKPATHR